MALEDKKTTETGVVERVTELNSELEGILEELHAAIEKAHRIRAELKSHPNPEAYDLLQKTPPFLQDIEARAKGEEYRIFTQVSEYNAAIKKLAPQE